MRVHEKKNELRLKIEQELKDAMKSGKTLKVSVLRLLLSEIKNREIEKKTFLEESDILKTIQTLIKQRKESVDAFLKGNRPDLAQKETNEIEILEAYLPKPLSNEELEHLIREVILQLQVSDLREMGKVIKTVLSKTGARADGKIVSEMVKRILSEPKSN